MTRLTKVAAIVGVVILMAISGCSGGGVKTVKVDGHVFHVPQEHLVREVIPWLPASQADGLRFVVNPNARPEEQMMVTIELTATTCHPKTSPASNQLASACMAAAQNGGSGEMEQAFIIEKVLRNGDPTQWEYRLKDQSGMGQGTVVASCYSLSDDGKAGLCTSLSTYKDLVYSVGLRDGDIQQLPAIRTKVREMLASWEGSGLR